MSGKKRILYIDDNPMDHELVRDALEQEHGGFEVVAASTRREFETLLRQGGYDAILSDFNILGFDGIQVLDIIRSHDPKLPVVIVTGTGSENIAVEALKRGAADYVLKSVDHIRRLPATIQSVLEKKQLREECRLAEERLRKSEEKFRLLYEKAPLAYQSLDSEGCFLEVNPAWQDMFGYEREQIIGKSFGFILSQKSLDLFHDRFPCFRELEVPEGIRCEMTRQDNSQLMIEIHGRIAYDSDGNFVQTHCILNDITRQHQYEEALKRWRYIFDYADWGVAVTGVDNMAFDMMNPAFAAMHGYTVEELLGRSLAAIHTPRTTIRLEALIQHCDEKGHCAFEADHSRKDGGVFPVWHDITTVRDSDGNVLYRVLHVQDITTLKKTEQELAKLNRELEQRVAAKTREIQAMQQELIQREKLAVIGQLAGGVAHDLRNPLGVISNSVYFLGSTLRDVDAKAAKHLEILRRESGRANGIVSELTDFAGDSLPELRETDINRVVRSALQAVEVNDSIAIKTELDEHAVTWMDPDQMERVLVNLINNAVQAMAGGGTLHIETKLLAHGLRFQVEDSGGGIAGEDLDRIFDPLVTTKPKGIGLGLCIVKDIMEKHGGSVSVASEVGKGSTFTAILPVLHAASDKHEP